MSTVLLFLDCSSDDCEVPDCRVNLSGRQFEILEESLSGGSGTQFTPDRVVPGSITNSSAQIEFTVKQIGGCHDVVGYGHVWSAVNANPLVGRDIWTDYGTNVNFNDVVRTNMLLLAPNTTYFVRSWVTIEIQDCEARRETYYNDMVTEITTLP